MVNDSCLSKGTLTKDCAVLTKTEQNPCDNVPLMNEIIMVVTYLSIDFINMYIELLSAMLEDHLTCFFFCLLFREWVVQVVSTIRVETCTGNSNILSSTKTVGIFNLICTIFGK